MIRRFHLEHDEAPHGPYGEGTVYSDGSVVVHYARLEDAARDLARSLRIVFLDRATTACGVQHIGPDEQLWTCTAPAGHADNCASPFRSEELAAGEESLEVA